MTEETQAQAPAVKMQVGRFALQVEGRHPFEYLPIFAHVTPVHVSPAPDDTILYYVGYSPLFKAVEQTDVIPAYQFRIDFNDDGLPVVTATELADALEEAA